MYLRGVTLREVSCPIQPTNGKKLLIRTALYSFNRIYTAILAVANVTLSQAQSQQLIVKCHRQTCARQTPVQFRLH
jgi:hypothetical protein